MTATLDEKFASFQFSGDWTSAIEENLKDILLNTWQEWGFEEIDEEFIIFVMNMIKKRDTMKEVADEMNGVGLDESQTKLIIERFVEALQPYAKASKAKEESTVIPESAKDPSIDRLLAPLKTSRDSNPKDNSKTSSKPTNPKDINRLLHSALSSARNNDNTNNNNTTTNNTQQQRKGKRNAQDFLEDTNNNNGNGRKTGAQRPNLNDGSNVTGNNNTRNIKQKTENHTNSGHLGQNNFPPYPPMAPYPDPSVMMGFAPPGMMSGPPPTDPVQYFEHMNQVAIKSGFKNAQEMLAMFHGSMAPPQYPPHPHGPPPPQGPYPGMNYPYPPNPYEYEQPAYHQPPRPHHAGRFQSGRSNTYVRGGLGRGRGGADKPPQEGEKETASKPSEPATKSESTATETSKSEATPAPSSSSEGNDQQVENKAEGDPAQSTWGNSGGRGRGGGRFAAGRGAPRAAGRFGGRTAAPPATTAVFFNPFAQNNNNTSLQALASTTTAPVTRAPFTGGRGGRGAGSAGRAGGNKVWVRPGTEETAVTTQQS